MFVFKDGGILEGNLGARQGILQSVTHITFCYDSNILLHLVTFCYILLHFRRTLFIDLEKAVLRGNKKGYLSVSPRVVHSLPHAILIDRIRALRSFRKS